MDFDVIVLGDYCFDIIFTGLDEFPQLGTEIVAKSLSVETGGACNTSMALHRLGVKTGWACEFGTDDFSQFILNRFREDSFPEDLFIISPGNMRKMTVSLSYPHDRAFIAYYDQGKMLETAFKGLLSKTARIVVIPALIYGMPITAASLLSKLKGTQIFMDGNSSESVTLEKREIRNALKNVRFYSPNAKEARRISEKEDLEQAVASLGELCETVIIKDGANGSLCCDKGKIYREPAYKVKVVDTTGAGDCFNAGFIKSWLDGNEIQTCLKWGNIAGALSTQKAGANGYRLSSEEIQKIISQEKI